MADGATVLAHVSEFQQPPNYLVRGITRERAAESATFYWGLHTFAQNRRGIAGGDDFFGKSPGVRDRAQAAQESFTAMPVATTRLSFTRVSSIRMAPSFWY